MLLVGAGSAFGQVLPPAPGTPPAPAAPAPPPAVPAPAKSVPYGAGMKVNLSPDGSKYLRFIGWAQAWAQYNENNSNTLRVGVPKNDQLAFSIRRARLITLAQLNPRFLLLLDLGMENQTAVSGGTPNDPNGPGHRAPFYVHEAVGEYRVNKYLSVGGGLNFQVGISRMSAASTATMLAYDIPVVNFPTLDQTDQFGFYTGFYAKGRVGGFDYRLAVDEPFLPSQANTPATVRTNVAAFYPRNSNKIYQGYFDYEFLDKESNLLPFTTGTYLGTKRVFNIGAGFHYNAAGMFSRPAAFTGTAPADPFTIPFRTHDIKLFGADVFYDAPIDTASNTAVTFYGVYYNYNFGPNYVRNAGVNNPGTSIAPPTGFTGATNLYGNALPLIGTGQTLYAQLGLLLPKKLLGPKAKLQPYVAYLHNNLEGLRNPDGTIKGVNVYDAGLNLYLDGHNAKFTLNYRARPDFSDQSFIPANNGQATVNSVNYRPEVTLQAQVYL
ncbi:hypothetical protein ACFQ48_18185 [Hymenobacter caeli]|uniref:Short chain amide porin n=1 Tax=Hymenobacter caeli TaxID=2735894 RepID=A0ABX2FSR8_9BACT|nr:hypothetical protein [Hymenobacter caeli]NRT19509.1 hypothetical protein [Hymenobacter caeli]